MTSATRRNPAAEVEIEFAVDRSEEARFAQEPLAEGEFFVLTCSVDDETEVRAAAQAALATLDRVATIAAYSPSVSYPNTGLGQALKADQ